MPLEKIYYLSQIIAVLAVLASLVFLGRQVSLSNQQTSQANIIAAADSQRDLLKQVSGFFHLTLDNPTVLRDVRLGLMSYDNAPHETKNNFATWAFALMHIMEQCVYMNDKDLITDSSFRGFETAALGLIVTPGGAEWWVHTRKVIGATLVEHLDNRLIELEGITPPFYELFTQFAPIEDPTTKIEGAPQ
jgi:hypothetical protein